MATTTAKPKRRTKATAWTALVKAKAAYCKGKKTQVQVKKAAATYVASAVKKGKTEAAAKASANRILKGGCSMTSSINGKKKSGIKTTRATAAKTRVTRKRATTRKAK